METYINKNTEIGVKADTEFNKFSTTDTKKFCHNKAMGDRKIIEFVTEGEKFLKDLCKFSFLRIKEYHQDTNFFKLFFCVQMQKEKTCEKPCYLGVTNLKISKVHIYGNSDDVLQFYLIF